MIIQFERYNEEMKNSQLDSKAFDFPPNSYVKIHCDTMENFIKCIDNLGLPWIKESILNTTDRYFDKKTQKFKCKFLYLVKELHPRGDDYSYNIHDDRKYFDRKVAPSRYGEGKNWEYAGDSLYPEEIEQFNNIKKYNL